MATPLSALEAQAMFDEWQALNANSKRSLRRAADLMAVLDIESALTGVAIAGVVGSKGKGTASVYATAALVAGENQVGTITSPGVIRHRDRVRHNGCVLQDAEYTQMLRDVIAARAELMPPTSESGYLSPSGLYTIGGLNALLQKGIRAAVIEAGIGGVADELSLLPLDAVIVTEIFNEHAEVLGPTVVDIAKNKIGVVSRKTKVVVSLPQTEAVRNVIERRCEKTSTELIWVDNKSVATTGISYPPGLNQLNAIAGVRAGVILCELMQGVKPGIHELRRTIGAVNYPGRLSIHHYGSTEHIVDSAISRDGLVTALVYARKHFSGNPTSVYLSMPSNKDLDGCIRELTTLNDVRRVFVNLPESHLPFPRRDQWPWEWIDFSDLGDELGRGSSLIVGTATYTAQVLELIGVTADKLF